MKSSVGMSSLSISSRLNRGLAVSAKRLCSGCLGRVRLNEGCIPACVGTAAARKGWASRARKKYAFGA
eukprot:5040449-Prymnesium_polylepis.1